MAIHSQGPKGEPGVKGEKGDPQTEIGDKVSYLYS